MSTAAGPATVRAAAPSFMQVRANEVTGGRTNSVSFAQANSAGNLIVVSVVWSNTGAVTVTDSRGNSYASAPPRRNWGSSWSEQTFYARNVAGGSNRITASFSTQLKDCAILTYTEKSG